MADDLHGLASGSPSRKRDAQSEVAVGPVRHVWQVTGNHPARKRQGGSEERVFVRYCFSLGAIRISLVPA